MITGELKNKIDQLWEMLWTEGNANPLTNIEQLTYDLSFVYERLGQGRTPS